MEQKNQTNQTFQTLQNFQPSQNPQPPNNIKLTETMRKRLIEFLKETEFYLILAEKFGFNADEILDAEVFVKVNMLVFDSKSVRIEMNLFTREVSDVLIKKNLLHGEERNRIINTVYTSMEYRLLAASLEIDTELIKEAEVEADLSVNNTDNSFVFRVDDIMFKIRIDDEKDLIEILVASRKSFKEEIIQSDGKLVYIVNHDDLNHIEKMISTMSEFSKEVYLGIKTSDEKPYTKDEWKVSSGSCPLDELKAKLESIQKGKAKHE